ncbi:hypothetical protein Lepto7375DRAFT_1989 [Leptolyngbya sp. PCC 7375]|nr:hypothetical protein Lepto7375DRAFT_1989 [Leptolyngbya sp. PCC 7375]
MTPNDRDPQPPEPDSSDISLTKASISREDIEVLSREPALLAQFLTKHNTQLNSIEIEKLSLAVTKEDNRHREEIGRQRITFAILGMILTVVLSSLLYSGITKDNDMPKTIINMLLAAIGGGGAVVLARRHEG